MTRISPDPIRQFHDEGYMIVPDFFDQQQLALMRNECDGGIEDQDAGYIKHMKVKPYLTCWIPLDDVTMENGTVFVLPYSRAGSREVTKHIKDENTNDMVGYHGDDPGIPVEVKAGTLVAFSSHLFHRSSPNTTDKMRRVFLLQYTQEAIYRPDGSPQNKVTPFLRQGERVELAGRQERL